MHTLCKKSKVPLKIEFTDEDLAGVHLSYVDALVVTLKVANYDVRWVLIDSGSVINVIFLNTLRKMYFDLRRIEPAKTKITRFSGEV